MRKCKITDQVYPRQQQLFKTVIPSVTFIPLAEIQIIYSFANSFARAGWVVGEAFGVGGGGGGIDFTKTVSVLTDEDHYIL